MNQHPPVHHEGWMVSDMETVFCWVPVPWLTMVVSSVVFYLKNGLLVQEKGLSTGPSVI
jgi:hypothetical protein